MPVGKRPQRRVLESCHQSTGVRLFIACKQEQSRSVHVPVHCVLTQKCYVEIDYPNVLYFLLFEFDAQCTRVKWFTLISGIVGCSLKVTFLHITESLHMLL